MRSAVLVLPGHLATNSPTANRVQRVTHCKKESREFRAREVVPQDHNLPAAESSSIFVTEHSLELSA
jgi:hypothetical protein